MNDRAALFNSLATIARRRRFNTALREVAWATCVISGALLVYQILTFAIAAPAVTSALNALFILLLIGIGVASISRCARPIRLEQTAAVVDESQDLKDEIQTAHSFARRDETSPIVDLQINRAIATLQRVNPRTTQIVFPRGIFAIAGLMFAASLSLWLAPRSVHSQSVTAAEALETGVVTSDTIKAKVKSNLSTPVSERQTATDTAQIENSHRKDASWAKLEAAIREFNRGDGSTEALSEAIKSRDAPRAVQLLEELDQKHELARSQTGDRVVTNASPADPSVIARLKELFNPGGNLPTAAREEKNSVDELTQAINLAQKLNEEMKASGANKSADHKLDDGNNPLQAAIPLERHGPREARRSQGQSGEFEGTTDVEGGAMGRRVTQSTAGAGGKPSDNEASDTDKFEADPVLGKRTMRLASQLEKLNIDGNKTQHADEQGTTDGIYAATRAQQAQVSYQRAEQRARYATEQAMSGERVPLAYRGTVKDYFLNLNKNR